jgi:hypothetical protein
LDLRIGVASFRLLYSLQLRGDLPCRDTFSSETDILQDARKCAKKDDGPVRVSDGTTLSNA